MPDCDCIGAHRGCILYLRYNLFEAVTFCQVGLIAIPHDTVIIPPVHTIILPTTCVFHYPTLEDMKAMGRHCCGSGGGW